MPQPPDSHPRIAVIGGGITGLAAAHRLVELDSSADVTLLEGNGCLGGVLQSVHRDGFLIERGGDNFITAMPWAVDLCRRIGFADQLVPTDHTRRKAFVVHKGRLRDIPEGFLLMAPSKIWPVLTTPILSARGKLRMACEYFVPARKDAADESLAAFVTRRLGREVYDRIVQPLIGGIYTADAEKLSVAATMPQFLAMERKYGGLIRGARRRSREKKTAPDMAADRSSSGARYSMFMAPRDGMVSLIRAIAATLPEGAVRLHCPVSRLVKRDDGRWDVAVGDAGAMETFDAVIVAVPAYKAATLLAEVDSKLSADLASIEYAGTAVLSVAYRREQIGHPLDGFGFVVPLVENRRILAGSFSSIKYPGRAPDGSVLFRAFAGGACQPELASLSDEALRSLAAEEFGDLLDIRGEPVFCEITRWKRAMAQYHVGHVGLVDRIFERTTLHANLQLAGNAYRGVGMPQCIHSGERAAERLLGHGESEPSADAS